jgi:hypothetical protein
MRDGNGTDWVGVAYGRWSGSVQMKEDGIGSLCIAYLRCTLLCSIGPPLRCRIRVVRTTLHQCENHYIGNHLNLLQQYDDTSLLINPTLGFHTMKPIV